MPLSHMYQQCWVKTKPRYILKWAKRMFNEIVNSDNYMESFRITETRKLEK